MERELGRPSAVKHVVITGGSRGLGFGLARAFLELGCRVTLSGRTEGSARAATDLLRASVPAHATALDGTACDVTRAEQLEALWTRARSHGPIDVWINNAGVSAPLAPLWELTSQALQDVIDTNVRGVLLGSWVALRGMREQESGVIYNVEGFGADGSAVRGALAYGASKCTVGYISKQLAREVQGSSVRVCTIEPGAVRTDMTSATWYGPGVSPLMLAGIEALALAPDEVARLLAPRLLKNQKNGARIRPWNGAVAWARVLLLPLWGMLRRRGTQSTGRSGR